jgi:glycosyltransferase involved in cell wall biosynthesis
VRIAVDARPLAHPLTGIGRYTESLLKRLVLMGHQWFLYSDRPITPRFELGERVQLRLGDARPGSALSLFYSQLAFPRWARGDCVDLFWSPRHHLPLTMPSRVARVVTVHDLVWKRYPETMRSTNRLLERVLMGPSLRGADQVICVSAFTAAEVAGEYPGLADRCSVIAEAAELAQENYEERYPLPAQPYLLFVGTLEPRKNLPRLLQAFQLACKTSSFAHQLLIVGAQGWGREDLPQLLQELGLEQRVILKGRVSDAELRELYAGSAGLVMPSLYEGFGLPALEAMQYGVPVLASNTGALPEVVGDGGLLVDPLSIEAIAGAMLSLCQDSRLHARLRREALSQAASFSWERAARQTLALLENVHQQHRSRIACAAHD